MRTKRVCIKCIMPIFDVIPNRPIVGQINSIELTIDQIRKCLVRKANVREILGNGQYKVLTLSNYDKFDEEPVLEVPEEVIVEPEIPEVVGSTEKSEEENLETIMEIVDYIQEHPELEEEDSTAEEVIADAVAEMTPVTEEEIPTVEVEELPIEEVEPIAVSVEEETPVLEVEETEETETVESEYRSSNNNYNKKKNKRR